METIKDLYISAHSTLTGPLSPPAGCHSSSLYGSSLSGMYTGRVQKG